MRPDELALLIAVARLLLRVADVGPNLTEYRAVRECLERLARPSLADLEDGVPGP